MIAFLVTAAAAFGEHYGDIARNVVGYAHLVPA
jgi:hypothetical protein